MGLSNRELITGVKKTFRNDEIKFKVSEKLIKADIPLHLEVVHL